MTHINISQASKRYKKSRNTIYGLINTGKLKAVEKRQQGKQRKLLAVEDLDALFGQPTEEVTPQTVQSSETFADIRTTYQDLIAKLEDSHMRELAEKDKHIQSLKETHTRELEAKETHIQGLKEVQETIKRGQQNLLAEQAAHHQTRLQLNPPKKTKTTSMKNIFTWFFGNK